MFYQTLTARRLLKGPKMPFYPWWPWPLTFDLALDLQTRPSEGPNTSSVQRFSRYYTQTKNHWRRQKQNIPQFTASGNERNIKVECFSRSIVVHCLCLLVACIDRHLFTRMLPVRTNDTSAVRYGQQNGPTHWS